MFGIIIKAVLVSEMIVAHNQENRIKLRQQFNKGTVIDLPLTQEYLAKGQSVHEQHARK